MLTLLAMERCRTAREAIKLMGSLAEKYGYGYHDGGEMLAVSDPKEIWIFEIMPVGPLWTPETGKPGAVWAAQRVPDDQVSVCPNESRIGEIDLGNSDFFLASAHVVSFAVEQGLYDPKGGKPFSLKRAYSPAEGSAAELGRPPLADVAVLRPGRPVAEVQAGNGQHGLPVLGQARRQALRPGRHGPDPRQVRGHRLRSGPRPPRRPLQEPQLLQGHPARSASPTSSTRPLTQCRSWLPDPIGGIVWVALGAQDTSCYIPFYAGATEIPKSFAVGDHFVLDRASARWAFDYVDFHAQVAYNAAIEDVKAARKKWEDGALDRIGEIDAQAGALYRKSPGKAVEFVTGFGLNNAQSVVAAWWKLGDDLWVKYNHLGFYDAEKRARRPHPDGQSRMVEQGRPGLRRPERTRKTITGTREKELPMNVKRLVPLGGTLILAVLLAGHLSTAGRPVRRRRRHRRGRLHVHHRRQAGLDRRLGHDHAHLRLRHVRLDLAACPGGRP